MPTPSPLARLLLLLGMLCAGPHLCAQDATDTATEPLVESARLENDAISAFFAGDLDRAERLLREQITAQPTSPVPHYNLACVLAARGQNESAVQSIRESIELGFADLRQLENDPHLASLRELSEFRAILDNWSLVLDARADAVLVAAQKNFGRSYTYERQPAHRLLSISAYTPQSTADAYMEIDAVAAWASEHVFGPIHNQQQPEKQASDGPPDAWVSVVLPTPQHFRIWASRQFGADAIGGIAQVGGLYDHDSKELWAADLGGTLRHEFFHVLHWRSMNRLGQRHPMWIQEGLAALVETVDRTQGSIHPVPCVRTNIVRRHASQNLLIPVEDFAGEVGTRIYTGQPLRFYAQARVIFLYLHDRGLLSAFYSRLSGNFASDRTGLTTLLTTCGFETPEEFDVALRAWARELPETPEEIRPGQAALGVRVDVASTGEGLTITGFPGQRPTGLRLGDIITHVGGRPTRDYFELVRVISAHKPGDQVQVNYRRRTQHAQSTITLTTAGRESP